METEIEAKFPDVDAVAVREKLEKLGARRVYPEVLMRRKNFDYPDNHLAPIGGWIRVRDEGSIVTLSYKELKDRSLHGTKELSVVVSDFDKTCAFLEAIGLECKSYQETKREKWMLKNVEVTIDTWPWIPTLVEIEGPEEIAVKDTAATLGFDWSNAMHGSIETVYQMHYDFTEREIIYWKSITFVPAPAWLLAKKKN